MSMSYRKALYGCVLTRMTGVIAEGSGFVVNEEGYVLTNAHLLVDAERLTVLVTKTGAEMLSQQIFASRDMNLALLRVQGLDLPPLNLSEQGAAIGRIVQTLKSSAQAGFQVAQGTIGTHQDVPGKTVRNPVVHLLQHNAMVTAKGFGMPLFNECGDVVGINLPDPDSGRWPFRKEEPRGTIFALRSGDIIGVLKGRKIAHSVIKEECLSAIEQEKKLAEDRIKAARDSAEAVAKAARDKARAERVARLAAEKAKARADSISKAVADSINAAQQALEREKEDRIAAQKAADSLAAVHQQEQKKTSQRLQLVVLSGGALVILVLLGWFLFARRKKAQLQSASSLLSEAEHEAEAARQSAAQAPQLAPFKCLLEGKDNTGQPFALSIPALALPSGATLGRSPTSAEFIIDHEAVSREHIRLSYTDGDLYVEDLNALNGTRLNGRLLNPHEQVVLQNNDQLEIGPVVFQVRLIQE